MLSLRTPLPIVIESRLGVHAPAVQSGKRGAPLPRSAVGCRSERLRKRPSSQRSDTAPGGRAGRDRTDFATLARPVGCKRIVWIPPKLPRSPQAGRRADRAKLPVRDRRDHMIAPIGHAVKAAHELFM